MTWIHWVVHRARRKDGRRERSLRPSAMFARPAACPEIRHGRRVRHWPCRNHFVFTSPSRTCFLTTLKATGWPTGARDPPKRYLPTVLPRNSLCPTLLRMIKPRPRSWHTHRADPCRRRWKMHPRPSQARHQPLRLIWTTRSWI